MDQSVKRYSKRRDAKTRRRRKQPKDSVTIECILLLSILLISSLIATTVYASSSSYVPIELEQEETVEPLMPEVIEAQGPIMPEDDAKVEETIHKAHYLSCKVTAYCPCETCCDEYADGITKIGTIATSGRTIAVDPDEIPLGSTVYIDGHQYIAEDIGGQIQGKRIDLYFDSHDEALEWGVRYKIVKVQTA